MTFLLMGAPVFLQVLLNTKSFKQKSSCSAYTSVIECSLLQVDECDCDVMQVRDRSKNIEGGAHSVGIYVHGEIRWGAHRCG